MSRYFFGAAGMPVGGPWTPTSAAAGQGQQLTGDTRVDAGHVHRLHPSTRRRRREGLSREESVSGGTESMAGPRGVSTGGVRAGQPRSRRLPGGTHQLYLTPDTDA